MRVNLRDAGGGLLAFRKTNLNGHYRFSGICQGTYLIEVDLTTVPAGLVPSPTDVGTNDKIDSDPNPFTYPAPDDTHTAFRIDFGFTDAPSGDEGCTPGYWKQPQHFDSWPPPYMPSTAFSAVFDDAFPGEDLLVVLEQGGGALVALGRHTVAALLYAASPGVAYPLADSKVIDMFNAVFPGSDEAHEDLKDVSALLNEAGCPLN